MKSADIAIIGGGIIGQSIAFEVAQRSRARILIIDHGVLGGEASPAAAGILPVASGRARKGIVRILGKQSVAMYPRFVDAIREAGGASIALERPGFIELATSDDELRALVDLAAYRRAEGFAADVMDRADLVRAVPGVGPNLEGGVRFPDEMLIEPKALLRALTQTLETRVSWMRGAAVASLQPRERRVTHLAVGDERIAVGQVVLAAGWWSAALARSAGTRLPVRPVRGEMLAVRLPRGVSLPILSHAETRIVPRSPDTVWLGATMAYDAHPEPTAPARRDLIERAAALFPGVECGEVTAHWTGIRPGSAIRRPVIDRLPTCDNVIAAVGHHRSGYVLAPLTAAVAASLLLGEPLPVPRASVAWRAR